MINNMDCLEEVGYINYILIYESDLLWFVSFPRLVESM